MARRKRPVALFEVIHKDKRFAPKTVPPLERHDFRAKNPPQNPNSSAIGAALFGGATLASKPPAPPAASVRRVESAQFNQRSSWQSVAERARAWRQRLTAAAAPWLDRLKQHLAPHAPIFAGVIAASIVIGGVTIARHLTRASNFAGSGLASLQQIRQQAPRPGVLEVAVQTHPIPPQPDGDGAANAEPSDALAQSADEVLPPASRQVNLNYVLVQSYGDEKTADEARDFLNKNGIPCTIERGVKNWRKDFYLVVGLQGFARISGPDYAAYRNRIESLSVQFASHSSYRGFAPQAVKWERTN
jgi:hypothetical protein